MAGETQDDDQIVRRLNLRAVRNKQIGLTPEVAKILSAPEIRSRLVLPEPGTADLEGGVGAEGKMILFVLDSSPSMVTHEKAVVNGYNGLLDQMRGARNTLIHTVDIYGKVISPVSILENAKKLNRENYRPSSGNATPLRDSLIRASAQLVHEIARQHDDYKRVNGVIMVLTDGDDNNSKHSVAMTRKVIENIRQTHNTMVIGAGLGNRSLYLKTFGDLGIPEEFVISGANAQEMFRLVGDVTASATDQASFRALAIRGLPSKRIG